MWNVDQFDAIKISIASPDDIRKWSYGEVKKPETINYRTHKPERDGLFCEKIFGPTHDWTCACGKYKSIRYKGIKCERCGVEITRAKVRRERMGHIELAAPVAHIWYAKGTPSYIALLLDISPKDLEKVLYFNSYIVTNPGNLPLMKKQLLAEKDYRTYVEKYGNLFEAMMGAEAIDKLLSEINLEQLVADLKAKLGEKTALKKHNILKRLEVAETFLKSGTRPEWMIIKVLPVIPPDLRPMVQLDGGRFATSDLNDLYRRVINRNNRLKKLIDLGAPEIIVKNEKRMLQEAVNSLIDNGRRGRPVTGPGKRPLKSLNDMLKGKQGRFRQNLLGKRVDYSGRSVIVVGPNLKIHQCGLPKKMALELFKPFIMNKLVTKGIAHNIKSAKKMLESGKGEVWDLLDEVIRDHPVLLNRAPTLHRLGIQAFEPVLVEGKAIQISPLVTTPFNADFDGDQMAVHVPLLIAAQAEARLLMLSAHNLFSPASGKPIMVPTQDMALGCYYLTKATECKKTRVVREYTEGGRVVTLREQLSGSKFRFKTACPVYGGKHGREKILDAYQVLNDQALQKLEDAGIKEITIVDQKTFASADDMRKAYELGHIELTAKHFLRMKEGDKSKYIETTVGRLIFNEVLPPEIPYVNQIIPKRELLRIIEKTYRSCNLSRTAKLLDDIKEIGFRYATRSGLSFAISELLIPKRKAEIISAAEKASEDASRKFASGTLNREDKRQADIDVWIKASTEVEEEMMEEYRRRDEAGEFNSVYMMAISGARGSIAQVKQLAGMRGLMSNPHGDIIDFPIKSNFRDGLTQTEYFISTYGARKGLVDTALRTADSGYLTRRLVDVAQDVIIKEHDCGTVEGIEVHPLREKRKANNLLIDEIIIPLHERIVNRIAAEDVIHPETKAIIAARGTLINEEIARQISLSEVMLPVDRNLIGSVTADIVRDPRTAKIIVAADRVIDERVVEHLIMSRIDEVKVRPRVVVRSPLTCKTERGLCQLCYSVDLSTGRLVEIGETAGIVAAQSIGEPGTQLTMRTFHIGGIALAQKIEIKAKTDGILHLDSLKWTYKADKRKTAIGGDFVEGGDDRAVDEDLRRTVVEGNIIIEKADGQKDVYPIPTGANLSPKLATGQPIRAGDVLCEYNPDQVVSQFGGTVSFSNLLTKDGIVVSPDGAILITKDDGSVEAYPIPQGAYLRVSEGDNIAAGTLLAETVAEQKAAISGIDGKVEFYEIKVKNNRVISDNGIIFVTPLDKKEQRVVEYTLPQGVKEFRDETSDSKHGMELRVRSGNEVKAKDELLVITSEIDGIAHVTGKKSIVVKKDSKKEYKVPNNILLDIDKEKKTVALQCDTGGMVKIVAPKSSSSKTLLSRRIIVTEEKEYRIPADANLKLDDMKIKQGARVTRGDKIVDKIPFKSLIEGEAEVVIEPKVERIEVGVDDKKVTREKEVLKRKVIIRDIREISFAKDSTLKDKIVGKVLNCDLKTRSGQLIERKGNVLTNELTDEILLVSPIGGYVRIEDEIPVRPGTAGALKKFIGRKIMKEVVNPKTGAIIAGRGKILTQEIADEIERHRTEIKQVMLEGQRVVVSNEFTLALRDTAPVRDKLMGKTVKNDVFSPETGELIVEAGKLVDKEVMEAILSDNSVRKVDLIDQRFFDVPEGARIKVKDGAQIKAGTELITPSHLEKLEIINQVDEYEIDHGLKLLVNTGDYIKAGADICEPLDPIYSEIDGRVNYITKFSKRIGEEVIVKITVYSGKEYEIPEGLTLKVKNGDIIEPLTHLTEPVDYEKIVKEKNFNNIIRVERQEKKYKISSDMTVLVRDGAEVKTGDKLAVLTNFKFDSFKTVSEKVHVNRRNVAALKHYPIVPDKITIKVKGQPVPLYEEIDLEKIKSPEDITGKRIDMTIVSKTTGDLLIEADKIVTPDVAKVIYENRKNLNAKKVRLYDPKITINYQLGEITFEERPADTIDVEYTYEVTGVVKLIKRTTKEGKERTTIGQIIVQAGEAHQIVDGAELKIEDKARVKVGDILAKWGTSSKKTIDIIQGLPRVAELFEARNPKKEAIMAEFSGVAHRSGANLIIESPTGERKQYKSQFGAASNFIVFDGEYVWAGDPITEGHIAPKKLCKIAGVERARQYLIDEIQHVYKGQGVTIDDKHIEVIVRQMFQKVKVILAGDTRFLPREIVTLIEFNRENQRVAQAGGTVATGERILQGITKASLTTDSFISAASFQETTRVLTQASIKGKIDYLKGLKENLIIGKLIPAGTGMPVYKNIALPPFEKPMVEEAKELSLLESDVQQLIERSDAGGSAAEAYKELDAIFKKSRRPESETEEEDEESGSDEFEDNGIEDEFSEEKFEEDSLDDFPEEREED